MTEKNRKLKGCYGVQDRQIHQINREIFFNTCIGNFFSAAAISWLEIYRNFEKGIMPYPGSLMDQPNKILEVFRVIESYKQDKILSEQQKQKSRMSRGRK